MRRMWIGPDDVVVTFPNGIASPPIRIYYGNWFPEPMPLPSVEGALALVVAQLIALPARYAEAAAHILYDIADYASEDDDPYFYIDTMVDQFNVGALVGSDISNPDFVSECPDMIVAKLVRTADGTVVSARITEHGDVASCPPETRLQVIGAASAVAVANCCASQDPYNQHGGRITTAERQKHQMEEAAAGRSPMGDASSFELMYAEGIFAALSGANCTLGRSVLNGRLRETTRDVLFQEALSIAARSVHMALRYREVMFQVAEHPQTTNAEPASTRITAVPLADSHAGSAAHLPQDLDAVVARAIAAPRTTDIVGVAEALATDDTLCQAFRTADVVGQHTLVEHAVKELEARAAKAWTRTGRKVKLEQAAHVVKILGRKAERAMSDDSVRVAAAMQRAWCEALGDRLRSSIAAQ